MILPPMPPFPGPGWGKLALAFTAGALGHHLWQQWRARYAKEHEMSHSRDKQTEKTQQKSAKRERSMTCETSHYLDEPMAFGNLSASDSANAKIPLKSVHITGDVHGLLFSSTIIQTFTNEDKKLHEVIYTFPVAWNTALLGIAATIGEKRLTGQVIEKKQAEKNYEKALSEGNSAIMVQQSAKGLCAVNLGNIKPGESISIEIRCARLLRFEQNRVRLCIPTVISERYGDEHMPGGLASHETAVVNAKANYPFSLEIRLFGEITKGRISCPSHNIEAKCIENGLVFSVSKNAALDRDFVLLAEGIKGNSLASYTTVGDETMMVASFSPSVPEQNSPLALKILVDCSGSMSGGRINAAKKRLQQVVESLEPRDMVSFSRFGSDVRRETSGVVPCTTDQISLLKELVKKTDADLGGTETENALQNTFEIQVSDDTVPAVLLITDGDIWNVEGVIKCAKESGHRIFAIGVGSAPAESLLREMAEETGGACEFVTESEDIRQAVIRMFNRMRSSVARNVHVTWNNEITWQSRLPKYLYDGETIHCMAISKTQKPLAVPILHWETDETRHAAAADHFERVENSDLFRLGKFRQMQETTSESEQKTIALENQLLSEHTSLFLLIERAEEDKVHELATVQQVPQMVAHGHGCYRFAGFGAAAFCFSRDLENADIPAFIRRPFGCFSAPQDKNDVVDDMLDSNILIDDIVVNLKSIWQANLSQMKSVELCLRELKTNVRYYSFYKSLQSISSNINISEEQICSILMILILKNYDNECDRHSMRLINAYLKNIKEDTLAQAKQKVNELLNGVTT